MISIEAFIIDANLKGVDPSRYITTSDSRRSWMDKTPNRFAYRCLPMVIANQFGWVLHNNSKVELSWDGGQGQDAIHFLGQSSNDVMSHFGSGIVTWNVPLVFRTPPGTYLIVTGPPNDPKRGFVPLEGVVETDWLPFSFTMNWKCTEPNTKISIEAGEPIARIFPYPREYIESFEMHLKPTSADPIFEKKIKLFAESRLDFNKKLKSGGAKEKWQKHYMKGMDSEGTLADAHNTKIDLHKPRIV